MAIGHDSVVKREINEKHLLITN